MAKYFLTPKAIEDLSQIWEYTYEVWSERQADKYYELLTSSFQDIMEDPGLGKRYPEINGDLFGLRIGKHIVFYRVVETDNLEIIRILHQRMDLRSQLQE